MDRDFWRENWPIAVCGLLGLTVSAVLLSNATGQPLLPQIDFKAEIAPYIPGLLAISKTAALVTIITVAIAVAGFLTLYARSFISYKMEQLASKKTVERTKHVARHGVPINDYRQRHQIAMPATEMPEQVARTQVLSHALHERLALRSGVIALLNDLDDWTSSEEREQASAESLIAELKQAIKIKVLERKSRRPVAKPSQSALNGPSWRDMAQLVEWCRKEPAIGLKASRNAFRAAGIRISDADLQPGGAFNEWVRNLEVLPSPTAHGVPDVDAKQAEMDGRTGKRDTGRTERPSMQRSQPRKRKG